MGKGARHVWVWLLFAVGTGLSVAEGVGSPGETKTTCGVGLGVSALGPLDASNSLRGVPPPVGCDDGSVIDLMVVYTVQARMAAGSVAEIQNRIAAAVADANAALSDSLIDTTIRLVHTQEVVYAESGVAATDAPRLINDGDGFLDEVHPLRNFYGADCVSLWVDSFNYGGVGFYPDASLTGIGASGFTIMRQDNYVFHTLAHELGHNFFCGHDRANTVDAPYAEYSYGYREPGATWHDIMAYPPGDTIPYFANPNVMWPGPVPPNPGPTGVAEGGQDPPCDIARTMNELRFHVANFRPTAVPGLPNKLHARASAPAGGDGLSWATAFGDLQDALCAAAGSQGAVQDLWVAAGAYKPDRGGGDRAATFRLLDGVTLFGGFNGTETLLSQRNPAGNVTVLSGDIGVAGDTLDNSLHVVNGSGKGPTAVLDGFTITGGRADAGSDRDDGGAGMVNYPGGNPTVRNCVFTQNTAARYGAAVYNYPYASPSFTTCTFSNNTVLGADWPQGGGAVYNYDNCNPSFDGCTFTGNSGNLGGAVANLFASSPNMTNCTFQQNQSPGNNREGGAVYNYTSCHPVLTDSDFVLNTAERGGGVYAAFDCDPVLTRCTFTNNSASEPNGEGGAFYGYTDVNPSLEDCTFTANTAVNGGAMAVLFTCVPSLLRCAFDGNIAFEGGALYHYSNVSPIITGCTFRENEAGFSGAMANYFGCSPTVTACVFSGNSATDDGGALDNYVDSSPSLVNCLFAGNTASFGGAIISLFDSSASLINCTLVGNSAVSAGGGVYSHNCNTSLVNTILWDNTSGGAVEAQQITGFNTTPVLNYCTVEGWTSALGGTNNNGSDPLFVDADGADNDFGTLDDNARLDEGSPAIDSADNASVPPEATTDLDDRPRIVNGTVDRGAYEYNPLPGDIDQDGDVDLADHAAFAECMRGPNLVPNPTPPPMAGECLEAFDFNADSDVDLEDFAAFGRAFEG